VSDEEEFWNPKRDHDDAPRSPRPLAPGAFSVRERTMLQRVVDRVADLRSDARVGVAVLVVVAVLAGIVW
jgi:hypothetical protein